MADVSDPEDEIVDIGPRVVDLGPDPPMQPPAQPACSGDHGPHGHSHAPGAQAHGHSHGPARGARAPVKAPPGSDRWPAVYPLYINKLRTRQQVCLLHFYILQLYPFVIGQASRKGGRSCKPRILGNTRCAEGCWLSDLD